MDATLLRKELRFARVDVRHMFPSWARSAANREHILEELLVALEPNIHEGLIPHYGSIIVPADSQLPSLLPMQQEFHALAREAADGSAAVMAWEERDFRGLFLVGPSDAPELQLIQVVRRLQGIAIRRQRSGVVNLYSSTGNLKHLARRWTVSPPVGQAVNRIRAVAPMVDGDQLTALLDFAYYVLSPWGIGATLVWILSEREGEVEPVNLRPLSLNISPAVEGPSLGFIAHLLAQHDGATIISNVGTFLATGVHLTPSPEAQRFVPPLTGMRHTSASRASYDLSDALIITVSADGPVTVFSDGANIFELRWYSADREAEAMHRAYGEPVEDAVFTDGRQKRCGKCGKTSFIEILTVAGYRDHEEAHCPICGEEIDSAMCFQIHANIRKTF